MNTRPHRLLAATIGYGLGCWIAASVDLAVVPVLVVAGAVGVAAVAADVVVASTGALGTVWIRTCAIWVVVGAVLFGGTRALAGDAGVRHAREGEIAATVATDQGGDDQVVRWGGRRLRLVGAEAAVPLGSSVAVAGEMRPVEWPPERLRRDTYKRVAGEIAVDSVRVIRPPNVFVAAANAVRGKLQSAAHAALDRDRAALLLGLLIGDDSKLGADEIESFRRAGLTHLVAVSGSNLVLILGALTYFLGRLPLRMRTRIVVVGVALAFYVVVTRGEPSVIRAATMAVFALGAAFVGAPRDAERGFLLAVLVLGVVDPFIIASVGFQLSVAATAGIIGLFGPLRTRIARYLPPVVAAPVALTLAAQIAVAPLLVWHFESISLVSILANVIAVPVAGAVTIGGAVLAPFTLAVPSVFAVLGVPLGFLLEVGDVFGNLPLAEVEIGRSTLVIAAVTALIAVGVGRLLRISSRVLAATVVVIAVVAGAVAPVASRAARLPECAGPAFLDVGQGDAHVLRDTDGTSVLVDTGPSRATLDGGLSIVGVGRVDLVIVTHGHADHLGGLEHLVRTGRVRSAVVSAAMTWPSQRAAEARDALYASGTPVAEVGAGDRRTVGGIELEFLWPETGVAADDPNETSLVVLARVGGIDTLLLGDVGSRVQRRVAARLGPRLDDIDVVKVAHQGARDQDAALAADSTPAVAAIPVGPNSYGHPAPGTEEMYADAGAEVVRTDRAGSVAVCASTNGLTVHARR